MSCCPTKPLPKVRVGDAEGNEEESVASRSLARRSEVSPTLVDEDVCTAEPEHGPTLLQSQPLADILEIKLEASLACGEAQSPSCTDSDYTCDLQLNQHRNFISGFVLAVCFGGITFLTLVGWTDGEPICHESPRICEPCGVGTSLLPLGGDIEQSWPPMYRAIAYLFALCWCFFGVAIARDTFMEALERITSREVLIQRSHCVEGMDGSQRTTVTLWIPTVSNLSLMALGSSAPQTLLSVIETIQGEFFIGGLGPSTIVGAASFDLLVTTAVCICSLPAGQTKRIQRIGIFTATGLASIAAYLWVVFILRGVSPDRVDAWEAGATLASCPLFFLVARIVDHVAARSSATSTCSGADTQPPQDSKRQSPVLRTRSSDSTPMKDCDEDAEEEPLSWLGQFSSALYIGGSPEAQALSSSFAMVVHVFGVFWKVLFAVVPPPALCGGWPCFFGSLVALGSVTAVVSELAKLLSCCLSIPDEVTAITLIALGMRLPVAFASRTSVKDADTADNLIGNIMGSCVNVFLGFGLPWSVAAFYWSTVGVTSEWRSRYSDHYSHYEADGGGFLVPAVKLTYSICVVCFTAVVCLGLLVYRRCMYGGEVGGSRFQQCRDASFLAALWLGSVGASSMAALRQ